MSTEQEGAPRISGWDERRDRISLEYEQVAVRLFAERGFRDVTVDDVAAELGVSARTLFRYFPSKEDMLLAFPRRNSIETIAALEAIEPSEHVIDAVWQMYRRLSEERKQLLPYVLEWQRAVAGAPQVLARISGELLINEGTALTRLCGRGLGMRAGNDVKAHAVAASLHGMNNAVLRFWYVKKGNVDLTELYDQAMAGVRAAFEAAGGTPD